MATIIIRNSTGSGAVPSSLVQGELAINTVDGKLFYGSGSGNVVKEFTGSASGGSTNTGSLLTTASFSNPNLTFTKGDGSTFNTSLISLVPTSASYALTASFVATASWATNAIAAGTAEVAKAVNTLASSTNADFYPTFVDSNNSPTAASEIVYTSNRITFNPSAQLLTVPRVSSTSITASAFTGSLTGSLLGTASYAVQALSASWAPSVASNPFPYTGSAIISGSLVVTGSLQVGVPGVNNPAIDTIVGTLSRGTQTKIDWINGYLNNSSGVNTVDWEGTILYDASIVGSVDWGSRLLNNTSGVTTLDWENSALYDASTLPSMDWQSRFLFDSAGNRSYNYDTRALIYPNGTTSALNYGTQGQIAMTGSVSITGSLTVSGSSTFTNIGPAVFTGSVSSLNGFTGSLQGTASWATNARTASFLSAGTYNITAQNANNVYISTNSTPGTYTIPVYTAGGEDSNNSIASSNASYDQTNGHFTMTVLSSSLFGTASWATNARTASFVNTLNQNVIITGGLAIGTSSLGSTENALVVGLPPAGGVGEGGQILLQASGGLYTTASMIDNYQNKFRILRGTNASSDAFKFQVDMHTGQVSIPNYNSATALTGSGVAMLGVDSSGNVLTTTIPGTTIFGQYGGTGFTNPIVTYLPFGFTTVSGTEAQRQVASPVAGSLKNFFLRTNNTSAVGSTTTFTIRVNGVATNIKITIGGGVAAAKFSDTTNSASIAVGDEISLQVSTSAGNGPQVNAYSFGIYPS